MNSKVLCGTHCPTPRIERATLHSTKSNPVDDLVTSFLSFISLFQLSSFYELPITCYLCHFLSHNYCLPLHSSLRKEDFSMNPFTFSFLCLSVKLHLYPSVFFPQDSEVSLYFKNYPFPFDLMPVPSSHSH